ncbi:Cytochrome c [Caulifigura coniformis]|uniref:Cytochrome c n=1 Tax=Caulifigura coniformis TaxID=2527983 RepID=A0A517SHM8_9PLAN|nr:PVC-type heme-binding CxxCH protein [Caulifigura coniformis]QDT55632.1 Cytochrome c [Caulifigura coniformis]
MALRGLSLALAAVLCSSTVLDAQVLVVPRRHDRPPGPPLSPREAVAKMTVPDGFTVDIVAAEPDLVNPVAMAIDEKGRFWVTESFEYPRREPGPGRDRIKVLEDTDGDGKVDKVTIFAEGLNIPSGIAVGHGGVWVANAPDLLFLQDTDGDLKADKTEVLMTGFGRTDTHELPNSFTWGPDGWLYGLNGVFNYCDVTYGKDNPNARPDHPGWKFTCALFRIHPRTREFQIFCEGTSNPWGLAINDKGDFFVSACVIDHLWHLTERGYYIRQGGPYPAHTWPIRSIVDFTHQKAAYCGITWFDSDAYPAEYRNTLYMGNIHGNCINADVVEPKGATYVGKPHPGFTAKADAWKNDQYGVIRKTGDEKDPKLADLLQANDQWFMPVVQKTGPDGCLYILDWYDQYHCYQDANADPEGIDRGKGRLYRLRYKDNPYTKPFDLAKKTDDELIELLRDSNVFYRETAQRLLAERNTPEIRQKLIARVKAGLANPRDPYRELFALSDAVLGFSAQMDWQEAKQDPVVHAWKFRILGDALAAASPADQEHTFGILREALWLPDPRVRIQVLIAAAKCSAMEKDVLELLIAALSQPNLDPLVEQVGWELLKGHVTRDPDAAARHLQAAARTKQVPSAAILDRVCDVILSDPDIPCATIATLLASLPDLGPAGEAAAVRAIRQLANGVQSRAVRSERLILLRGYLEPVVEQAIDSASEGDRKAALVLLGASWGDEASRSILKKHAALAKPSKDHATVAIESLKALIAGGDTDFLAIAERLLAAGGIPKDQVLFALSRAENPKVAEIVLARYGSLGAGMQPKAIDLLCERPQWGLPLLKAIQASAIPRTALNLNQLRRVAGFKNEETQALFRELYGAIRETRNPDRDRVIGNMRNVLDTIPGDPHSGQAVFKKVCAQCHKIYGEGADVGPDITLNGRNNWEQLLSNVLDPSLVIGKGYQARLLATSDGRVLTGLPVEETDQQVVLKVQGGKLETIPRSEIEEFKVSELSMMPEALEKQLTPQELADLFAFLALDKPPTDATARQLGGSPKQKGR